MKDKEFTFNGQREHEKVLEVVKNHPFVLFWPGLKAIFFLILGIATVLYISSQITGFVLVICALIAIGIFSRHYYDYSQSMFLITNQRIINVFQDGFWKRKIIETEISKIQDASSKTSGVFRVVLKFGDLIIRTAGTSEGGEIIVRNIPNPYSVQQRIANIKQ